MNEQNAPIPRTWRKTVASILRQGKPGTILIRQRARRDWASLPFCPFEYELPDVIAHALDDDYMVGRRHEMDEPGETYAFIFLHESMTIYGKVNLAPAGDLVIVYSAHRPLKGEEL